MAGAAAHNSGFIMISNLFIFGYELGFAIPREPCSWGERVLVVGLRCGTWNGCPFLPKGPMVAFDGEWRRRCNFICIAHIYPLSLSLAATLAAMPVL